jgi:hypothetical protein
MIQLKLDSKIFIQQINQKVDGIKELTRPTTLQEIAKAAFTILGERFVQAVDRESVQNPKKFHHVYEWGRLGSPDGRLFILERTGILGGSLSMSTSFLPSNVPVPRKTDAFVKGGRIVSNSDIFRYKASVMEKGGPISFVTNKITPFLGAEGEAFVAAGTKITILHPGGVQTQNAFGKFMIDWYVENTDIIMNSSGLYERIVNEASKVLSNNSGGTTQVRSIVASVANSIAGNREVIK